MRDQQRISALVVDDEALARTRVCQLLRESLAFDVVGEASGGKDALIATKSLTPDVLFLDIEMPDLSGFEVLEALQSWDAVQMPAVVFVTAFDRYAVQAFDANAVDYVLKPIDEPRFLKTMARVAEHIRVHRTGGEAPSLPHVSVLTVSSPHLRRYLTRFVVPDRGEVRVIPATDVECVIAADNYVEIVAGGRAYLLRTTISLVSARLDPERFVRVHRSAVVAKQHVVALSHLPHGEFDIRLRSGRRVRASRAHRATVRLLMEELPLLPSEPPAR